MYICVSKLQSLRLLMVVFLTVINALLSVIMIGILVTWIYFCLYIVRSFKRSPLLESIDVPWFKSPPKVSIIIPARNEENYIAKCLDSVLLQDYPNYEIIAVNDSSNDNTGKIIQTYSMRFPKVIGIDLDYVTYSLNFFEYQIFSITSEQSQNENWIFFWKFFCDYTKYIRSYWNA